MIKTAIDCVMDEGNTKKRKKEDTLKTKKILQLSEQPLSDLFTLLERHERYMDMLNKHGMATEERKLDIIKKMDRIFTIIDARNDTEEGIYNDDIVTNKYLI